MGRALRTRHHVFVVFVFLIAFLVILLASTLLFVALGLWALERGDLTQSARSRGRRPRAYQGFTKIAFTKIVPGPWAGPTELAHGQRPRSRPKGWAQGASPRARPKESAQVPGPRSRPKGRPGPRSWPKGWAQGAGPLAIPWAIPWAMHPMGRSMGRPMGLRIIWRIIYSTIFVTP